MNLDHLRSFYATAKYKSISKAAKELHLTQPGLSMQIQSIGEYALPCSIYTFKEIHNNI